MKTLSIHHAALDSTARHIETTSTVYPELRIVRNETKGAALERQLDEIQHTFSARWEW